VTCEELKDAGIMSLSRSREEEMKTGNGFIGAHHLKCQPIASHATTLFLFFFAIPSLAKIVRETISALIAIRRGWDSPAEVEKHINFAAPQMASRRDKS
jgi:hypothetical protein